MDRIFAHGLPASVGKLSAKHFLTETEGVYNGTTIKLIRSRYDKIVNGPYRQGIFIQRPGQPAQIFFGDHNTVNNLAIEMKSGDKGIESVARRLRTVSDQGSGMFYLGKPMDAPLQLQPSEHDVDRMATAEKLYGKTMEESANIPRSREQEEAKHLRDHMDSVRVEKHGGAYPSSSDGLKSVAEAKAAEQAAAQGPGTALTDGVGGES